MNKVIKVAFDGKLLANEGRQINNNVWEFAVYLGTDGFVYYIESTKKREDINYRIVRKDGIGEYLRWVDDIHGDNSGTLTSESNNIHYQAAWTLREIL